MGNYNLAVAYTALELYDALYLQKATRAKKHGIKKLALIVLTILITLHWWDDLYSLQFTAMGRVKEMVNKLGKGLCCMFCWLVWGLPLYKAFQNRKAGYVCSYN